MSEHLPILQSMFPKKMMLDADDIAACIGISKGHVYNMVSKKKFPIRLNPDFGDRIMVSVVQMAKYLDTQLMPVDDQLISKSSVDQKRKVGRPRGSTKAQLQVMCFQSDIKAAILKFEISKAVNGLSSSVHEFLAVIDRSELAGSESVIDALVHLAKIKLIDSNLMRLKQEIGF
jgi:hypothetical protein